jgi:hypothetical protein
MSVTAGNAEPVHDLYMQNEVIQNVPHTQHLGVTLQQNLKWDKQFDHMCTKANKRLDIINSLSHKLSRKSLDLLYTTFVRSILEYCDVLFCNSTLANLEQLDNIQKRAGRIVSGAIRGTSSVSLYNELSWENLKSRRDNRMLVLYSDIIHERAPPYLNEHLPETVEARTGGRYNLRNNNDLNQPAFRTETYRNSFFPTMTNVWNNTNINIRSIESRNCLRETLNRNRTQCNPYFLLGRRKLNIILARIRMGCSELNHHLFSMHIIPSPNCTCGQLESTVHYFVHCPKYDVHRLILVNRLGLLDVDFTLETILNGCQNTQTNEMIILAVDDYITETGRFAIL